MEVISAGHHLARGESPQVSMGLLSVLQDWQIFNTERNYLYKKKYGGVCYMCELFISAERLLLLETNMIHAGG